MRTTRQEASDVSLYQTNAFVESAIHGVRLFNRSLTKADIRIKTVRTSNEGLRSLALAKRCNQF
jgi:hypothetical protein